MYLKLNAILKIVALHRYPEAIKDYLQAKLDQMKKAGIISKIDILTEWVNNMTVEGRNNKEIRICLNPKQLNKCIIKDAHPISTIS